MVQNLVAVSGRIVARGIKANPRTHNLEKLNLERRVRSLGGNQAALVERQDCVTRVQSCGAVLVERQDCVTRVQSWSPGLEDLDTSG